MWSIRCLQAAGGKLLQLLYAQVVLCWCSWLTRNNLSWLDKSLNRFCRKLKNELLSCNCRLCGLVSTGRLINQQTRWWQGCFWEWGGGNCKRKIRYGFSSDSFIGSAFIIHEKNIIVLLLWKIIYQGRHAEAELDQGLMSLILKFHKDPNFSWEDIPLFLTLYNLENKKGYFLHTKS